MRKLLVALVLLGCLIAVMLPVPAVAQSTVDANTGDELFIQVRQNKSFHANGLYWVFYIEGTGGANNNDLDYRTSSDGETWSAKTQLVSNTVYSFLLDVFYDESTYFHIIYYDNIASRCYYRRGIPNADSSITWSAAWQNLGANPKFGASVAVNTDGYAFLGYGGAIGADVIKNANDDGTWATDWTQVNLIPGGGPDTRMLALTGGKVALVFGHLALDPAIRCWTGPLAADWTAQRDAGTDLEHDASFRAVAEDDDVHVVWREDNADGLDVVYNKYTYSTNSFGAVTELYNSVAPASVCWPTICRNTDTNDLFAFWTEQPVADHIYYRKYDSIAGTWEARVDWVNEAVIDGLHLGHNDYNTDLYWSSEVLIGLYYGADPFKLKFKLLSEPLVIETATASAVQQTTAYLRGNITSTGSGTVTVRGFQHNTVASTTGATTIQETGAFACGVYGLYATGLTPSTTYYFRAFATSSLMGTEYGNWLQFTTLGPASDTLQVETIDASYVTDSSAQLNGKITSASPIDPIVDVVGFQYGPTAFYGLSWTQAGSYAEFETFARTVDGLTSGLTYHFRAIAMDATGWAYGVDRTFTCGEPDNLGYIDITISEICGDTYDNLGMLGNMSHTQLIANGYFNSCANNSEMVMPGVADAYYLPIDQQIAVLVEDLDEYETEVYRYYLGTVTQQEDFDLILGYGNQSRVTHGDLLALEGGNDFQWEVSGYVDTTANGTGSYIVRKDDAFRIHIESSGNITAEIGAAAAPLSRVWATGVPSGRMTIRADNDNAAGTFTLYIDGVQEMQAASAVMPNIGSSWYFFGNMTVPSMEYIDYEIAAVDTLLWQPRCYIQGNQTEDRDGSYDGNITWGTNPPCVTISIGPIESDPIPDIPDNGGGVAPDMPAPSDWFSECTGEHLPFYDAFYDAATDMGMPGAQPLYAIIMLGVASAVGMGVVVFTGSLLFAFVAAMGVLAAGADSCIISLWMLFAFGLLGTVVVVLQKT